MALPPRHHRPAPAPRPREAIGFLKRRVSPLYGVKAVGAFLPALTRKAFEKYGFSTATLVTDWMTIAGRELAAFTAPERLNWPRALARPDAETGEPGKGRQGATLVLRVDGGRSLDVQHRARQLIERINAYFGYAAVAELRIVQAPVGGEQSWGSCAPRTASRPLTAEVAHIADPLLRDALARLGGEIKAGR
jgi:hypothetical protein